MSNKMNELERMAIEQTKLNSSRSTGMTNKTILIELLMKSQTPRLVAPIKAATLWFTKLNQTPTSDEYMKKVTSIKNSLDTLVSQFNNDDKIKNDQILNGHEMIKEFNGLKIVKSK